MGFFLAGYGIKRVALIAVYFFRNLIERNDPKCSVFLNLYFMISFRLLNKETTLIHKRF